MSMLVIRSIVVILLAICSGCQVSMPQLPVSPMLVVKTDATVSKSYQLLQDGQLPEAERLLRRSVERSPGSIADRTNLGILLARTGRVDEAATELEAVLSVRPNFCPALLQRAELELSRFEIDAAEASYRTCLRKQPENTTALLNLGILYELYRGELDQAVNQYQLYLQASLEPDGRVANWITDLNRRIAARPQLTQFAEVVR